MAACFGWNVIAELTELTRQSSHSVRHPYSYLLLLFHFLLTFLVWVTNIKCYDLGTWHSSINKPPPVYLENHCQAMLQLGAVFSEPVFPTSTEYSKGQWWKSRGGGLYIGFWSQFHFLQCTPKRLKLCFPKGDWAEPCSTELSSRMQDCFHQNLIMPFNNKGMGTYTEAHLFVKFSIYKYDFFVLVYITKAPQGGDRFHIMSS